MRFACLFCLLLTRAVFATAADRLTVLPDKPIVTPAFETAGINLVYTGDDNTNASMTVRYRPSGGTWKDGHPGLWVEAYPRGKTGPRMEFASRLFHLKAATTYDVEVAFSDPDGVGGPGKCAFLFGTRAEPAVRSTAGSRCHVDPGAADGGDGSANFPFRTFADTVSIVKAGNTVLLLGGVHELRDEVRFSTSGTPSRPIVIRAAPGAAPIVRGTLTGLEGSGTAWRNEEPTRVGVYSTELASKPYLVFHAGEYLGEVDSLDGLVKGQRRHSGKLYDIGLHGGWHLSGGRLYVKIPVKWNDWGGPVIDPSRAGVEPVLAEYGVAIDGSYYVVDGITFEYFRTSLRVQHIDEARAAQAPVVRNCTFRRAKTGLAFVHSTSALHESGLENVLVENCDFSCSPLYWYRDWTLGHDVYATDGIDGRALRGANGVICNCRFHDMENGAYVGTTRSTWISP